MTSFNIENPAVSLGTWVVVSGVSGFIGSHVADQLLKARYKVRGTTRDSKKNAWIEAHFNQAYGSGSFELVEVPDMTANGAFDNVVQGANGFIHVANDMTGSKDPDVAVERAVRGALNALRASAEAGIKRFVYTSSSFAATQPKPNKSFKIAHDTYNEEAMKRAWEPEPGTEDIYSASKVITERRIAAWIKENKSTMVVNAVLPNANIGPVINASKQGYPTSAGWVKALWDGNYDVVKKAPPQHYINVQDDARLHVIALAHPDVASERIFAVAGPVNISTIIDILRKSFPRKEWRNVPEDGEDLSTFEQMPKAEALLKKVYGAGFISLEESVRANAQELATEL
ncbi:aldehyde reductase [Fusarium pseudocircinatum]|uniref:Aldehyde reductase n=1 Tax=Fusarium pseudocircinatum TaxID=56676 RepID=A0A8H5KGQ7_9HYPO|nr:aldehyde reductase [Fusarium pseudocircinatum]